MNYVGQSALVASLSVCTICACVALTYVLQTSILNRRLAIPYYCTAWSCIAITFTGIAAVMQDDPAEGLFTTRSWFSAGWDTGMSMFSIRINTWWRYLIVVVYQIVRSFLGSLLTNIFRSYLLVGVQSGLHPGKSEKLEVVQVLMSQAAYNIFVFYSSLTDSYIMLSQVSPLPSAQQFQNPVTSLSRKNPHTLPHPQVDMTLITIFTTMVADALTTVLIMTKKNVKISPLLETPTPGVPKPEPDASQHRAVRSLYGCKHT